MLEGNKPDPAYPLPAYVRDYQIVRRFGWTYQEIQETPAVWLDWLLSIDGVAAEAEEKKAGNPNGGQGRG